MRNLLTTLVVSAFSLLALAADAEEHSDVIVLGKGNFSDFIKAESLALVEFYAPWCGHCQKLAPKYETAATELLNTAKLAKVDCTVELDLCQIYDIKGFPTLKVFEDGVYSDYQGTREVDGIVSYMKKMKEPRITHLTSDNHEKYIDTAPAVVTVAYVKSQEDPVFKVFKETADKLFLTYPFAYTTDETVASKAGISLPSIVLYKQFDDRKVVYKGELTVDELTKFINVESLPLLGEITPEVYATYVGLGVPIAYYFYDTDEQKDLGAKMLSDIAHNFKGKISFVYIHSKYEQHGQMLGCSGPFPWFTIHNTQTNVKYPLIDKIESGTIEKHVKGVLDGSIPPYLKSEAIPTSNDEPVKVVVGKNFDSIVLDVHKDVFLEVYAPWCGHCKKLAPVWEELGEKLSDISGIVIAKMDGTANDLPANVNFDVRGFPTLVLVKANTNEVVNYNGDRSLDDMLKFLQDNTAHSINVPTEHAAHEEL